MKKGLFYVFLFIIISNICNPIPIILSQDPVILHPDIPKIPEPLRRGKRYRMKGSGFYPNSKFEIKIVGEPNHVKTVHADENGDLDFVWTISRSYTFSPKGVADNTVLVVWKWVREVRFNYYRIIYWTDYSWVEFTNKLYSPSTPSSSSSTSDPRPSHIYQGLNFTFRNRDGQVEDDHNPTPAFQFVASRRSNLGNSDSIPEDQPNLKYENKKRKSISKDN